MAVDLVPSIPRHLGAIAIDMREIDRREAWAVWGMAPKPALRACRRRALWSLTALLDGQPIALIGLAALNMVEGRGSPFMLGTDAVYRCGRELLTIGPRVIDLMRQTCPVLENVVSAENVRAIRLLRAWGFEIGEEVEHHRGVPFLPFGMNV